MTRTSSFCHRQVSAVSYLSAIRFLYKGDFSDYVRDERFFIYGRKRIESGEHSLGLCPMFQRCLQAQGHLYDNVPKYHKAEARCRVRSYFSAGTGPYYRVHHAENKITPKQQDDIMQILARYGNTEGIKFNHYETDWNFNC